VIARLNERYIFPDKAQEIEAALRNRLAGDEYAAFDSAEAFCKAVTEHVQEICKDKHLRLRYSPEPLAVNDFEAGPTPEEVEDLRLEGVVTNFGFEKVERLPGNVGYLDLRGFFLPEIPGAGEAATAAMSLLANTSALIVDLRKNGGGSPGMVALLTTYLMDQLAEPTHLNTFHARANNELRQSWTLPYVPGQRFGGSKPVYVLTSNYTFSGAEEFSYNLKNLKRATLVGETTGGGAHPGGWVRINEHYEIFVPMGRPVNPISGTNWEGTGVAPDIEVPQEQAFEVAYKAALKAVLEGLGQNQRGPLKKQAEEARTKLAELEK
jgi:C-terminal processing protease CtpA/Prc